MTRFEEIRGRLVARADEECEICHPKTPRADVSPPSRRSADQIPGAGITPPSSPSPGLFDYDAGDVARRSPDCGDRAQLAARVVLAVMSLVMIGAAAAVLVTYSRAVS